MTPTVLAADEVDLPAGVVSDWLAALPADRQSRLATWSGRERNRSLVATRLLRVALARWGFAPVSIRELAWSADGRPSLPLPVRFSVSHCDGLTVCACWPGGPVGIDVERVGPVTAADVARYLTPEERNWAGADPLRFHAVWTRKEAVVKAADARGLRDLHEVRTQGDRADFRGKAWFTAPVDVGEGYAAHLATGQPLQPLAAERLDFAALM